MRAGIGSVLLPINRVEAHKYVLLQQLLSATETWWGNACQLSMLQIRSRECWVLNYSITDTHRSSADNLKEKMTTAFFLWKEFTL